jgi:uncharacterized membrane protein YbhN (UPF0104 family)
MKRFAWRRFRWFLLAAGLAVGAFGLFRFPWRETMLALSEADPRLLAAALLANLVSPVAKASAWHYLLRFAGPFRWRTAQEATFAGSAVSNLTVSVTGEAARVGCAVARDGVAVEAAVTSIALSRVAEAIGLAVFLIVIPLLLPLPPLLHRTDAGAIVVLVVLAALGIAGRRIRLPRRFRGAAEKLSGTLRLVRNPARMIWPSALALVNWASQWATFYFALRAFHIPSPAAASFTGLVATNVGGALRASPGNVGIFQASLVVALLPFHVTPQRAVAAGLAIQALQIVPIQTLAAIFFGWRQLSRARASRRGAEAEAQAVASPD